MLHFHGLEVVFPGRTVRLRPLLPGEIYGVTLDVPARTLLTLELHQPNKRTFLDGA